MFKKEGWLSRTWQAFWNPNRARKEEEAEKKKSVSISTFDLRLMEAMNAALAWAKKKKESKVPDESSSSEEEVEGLVEIEPDLPSVERRFKEAWNHALIRQARVKAGKKVKRDGLDWWREGGKNLVMSPKEHWHEKFRPYKYRPFVPDEPSSSSGVEVEGLVDIESGLPSAERRFLEALNHALIRAKRVQAGKKVKRDGLDWWREGGKNLVINPRENWKETFKPYNLKPPPKSATPSSHGPPESPTRGCMPTPPNTPMPSPLPTPDPSQAVAITFGKAAALRLLIGYVTVTAFKAMGFYLLYQLC